jgi:hypothetical protein
MNTSLGLVLLLAGAAVYFLPSIVAGVRDKAHGTGGVVLINIFLGWTLIGWLLAFIWACSGRTAAEDRREEQRHAELLRSLGGSPTPSIARPLNKAQRAEAEKIAAMMGTDTPNLDRWAALAEERSKAKSEPHTAAWQQPERVPRPVAQPAAVAAEEAPDVSWGR